MTNETETNFDLPEVEETALVRVYMAPGESSCVSCEG